MEIPRSLLDILTRQLNQLSEAARRAALEELERIEWADIADLREKSFEVVDRYLEYSTQLAAQHSADSFDAVRTLAVGEALGAEAVSGYDRESTYGAIKALVQDVVDTGVTNAFFDRCLGRIDYDLKRAAAYATNHNCRKDPLKPKWARIPMGAETCMFCIMLASRGFVYSSENNAGGHWHEHCDCRAIQGYPGMKVKGYDPDKLLEQWYESDHYSYMKGRAKRLADANHIRYEQKLLMKRPGMTKETADILTKHLQDDFKRKYGKDYSEVYRKAQASKYRATLSDGTKIGDFSDVQKFLRDSKSKRDLEHRYSMLVNAYGTKSEMIRSAAMKNAVRHVEKRYSGRKSVGAMKNPVYSQWENRIADTSKNRIKNTQRDHVKGEKQFENNRKTRLKKHGREPSFFDIPYDDLKSIVLNAVGSGEPVMTKDGEWANMERCSVDDYIGVIIGHDGKEHRTRHFKIHYGDDGIHAVPLFVKE